MPPPFPIIAASAAVTAALAAWAGVVVTVLMVLWNKLDKRFDDLEARWNQRFDDLEARQNKRFDDLKAELQEGRAETRALMEAVLSVKAKA
ncbi:MAG: hypothetical protein F4Z75_08715 [Synechococcus sp. SB0668_bin_15]|nr:hypothetical protein [Synechococcus sp. SB0668_bin_15]MXZ83195.1 hypothetical protein [Synechococcus sp. SB0666_bin_14]MYA90807.1 hypothetical protein [Synechococcus sp. SB0663_bin_10]MYC49430.1 hypothetical protein [Synechococcus sp. SB0662_bin_14]MYG47537.1 hypothetical protein [Synechococcus sp. SB0675_bin_6]MYJ59618.1 hypothetical protein [Synechococcus sp. SB0672_bin_6]MYK91675.1 hypothetical protein [Synechococcus sp. SB0669_bin_8]